MYVYGSNNEINNEKESDSMKEIEKLSNPKVMNLFWRKVNVKMFWFQ